MDKKKLIVVGLFALVIFGLSIVAIFYYSRYSNAQRELNDIREELETSQSDVRFLREDLNRAKANAQKFVQEMPDEGGPPQQQPSPLDRLSTSTKEALLSFAPFSEKQYVQAKISGDNLVIVINESARQREEYLIEGFSVWFVDFEHEEMRRLIGGVGGDCNYLELENWSRGVVVHHSSSPCEAVGKTHSYYFDQNATLVAETEVGNFNRDGTIMDAKIGDTTLRAQIIQPKTCAQPENAGSGVYPEGWQTPTTTISGIAVNGRRTLLPNQIEVECQEVYGGGYENYQFPGVDFDGRRITFHLPGHDAAISQTGSVTFTALPTSYFIPKYERRIIREDQNGFHVVRTNIMDDSIFEDRLVITRDYPAYYFDVESMNAGILTIKISRFNDILNSEEDTGMLVEYDTKADKFQNLRTK